MKPHLGLLVFFAVAGSSAAAFAQPSTLQDGRVVYQTYCASCHGVKADGAGPAAAALRHAPPDLTKFALSNGGVFPAERLRRIIDGKDVVAHGSPEMPVWGAAFRGGKEGLDAKAVRARIEAIVAYLDSIQLRRGQ
jgi:mono/diheme cytochrome c family protein